MTTVLSTKNLQKIYRERVVFKDFHLSIQQGEFLCLLGPSGCGKSTLLRLLAGLEEPTSGEIQTSAALRKAFVFQEAQLLSWRTALENVRLPLELQDSSPAPEKALQVLKHVGLEKAAELFPHELSGGMKMRVSLARALVSDPQVLFLDEPFSSLDEVHRQNLQVQLKRLCQERNLTVVFVTHSSDEAAFLADRVLILGSSPQEMPVSYSQERNENLRQSEEFHRQHEKLREKLRRGTSHEG